jgi:hypothetical protein
MEGVNFGRRPLFLILSLAFGLRLIAVDQGLWLDEAAQALESRRGAGAIVRGLEADFHPPLYHLILHVWMKFSVREVWLRFLSVLLGLGTVLGVWVLGNFYRPRVGFGGAFLLAINPFHLYYSQEVRPYPLAAFLYLWAAVFFVAWLRKKGGWRLFFGWVGLSALVLYSLYPAAVWFPAAGLFLLFEKEKVGWRKVGLFFFGLALAGLTFLPWTPRLRLQLAAGQKLRQALPGWETTVSPQPLKAVLLVPAKFVAGPVRLRRSFWLPVLFSLPLAVSLLAMVWQAGRGSRELRRLWLSFGLVPLIFLAVFTFFLPILEPKRVLFVLPVLTLGVAAGLTRLPGKLASLSLGILVFFFMSSNVAYALEPSLQREQWRQAVRWAEVKAGASGLVVFSFPQPLAPWNWYAGGSVRAVGGEAGLRATAAGVEVKLGGELEREPIVYFRYLADLTDPGGKVPAYLQERGYRVGESLAFPGVGLVDVYQK